MRFETMNPIGVDGSSDPRDLYDNAGIADLLINGPLGEYLSRLGVPLKSWRGIMQQVSDYLIAQGYESTYLAYGAGVVVQRQTQLVQRDGELYRVMNTSDIPLELSGTWASDAPKLQAVGDAALRQALASPGGTAYIGRGEGTLEDSLTEIDAAVNEVMSPGFLKQQNLVARTLSSCDTGDLSAFFQAIGSGSCTIVIAGDSIAENKSQVNPDDGWVAIFARALRSRFKDVDFKIANLSLAGRGSGNLFSDTYVGISGQDDPAAGFNQPPGSESLGHWPAGSTVGKPWRQHILDQQPDLVIQALGMNDLTGSSQDIASVTQICLDYYKSFAKVPSVVLMTPMQPATDFAPIAGVQEKIRQNAEIYRGLAAKNGLTLLDPNRLSYLYRDAVDIVNTKAGRRTMDSYPSGWSTVSGAGYTYSGGVFSGGGITRKDELMRDAHIDVTLTLASYSAASPVVRYREDPSDPASGYQVIIAGGSTAILYWQSTAVDSRGITPLVNGQPVRIEVRCRGSRHEVFINRKRVIDTQLFQKLDSGRMAIGIDGGTGTISQFVTATFSPGRCGRPMFSEADLYGAVNDFDTNPDSPGGSATNHPSALGHSVMYADACLPLLKAVTGPESTLVVAKATSAENFYGSAAGPSARLQIDGINGPDLLVGGAAGGEICSLQQVEVVTGGRQIGVNVQSTSSLGTLALLPVTLDLPAGRWMVTARATLSRNASGVLNAIDAVAVKSV